MFTSMSDIAWAVWSLLAHTKSSIVHFNVVWFLQSSRQRYNKIQCLEVQTKKNQDGKGTNLGKEVWNLWLRWQKTEYMWCFIDTDNEKPVKLDGIELKSVQFKYFGSVLSCDRDVDVRSHMKSTWCKWRELTGILFNENMPSKLKNKAYND